MGYGCRCLDQTRQGSVGFVEVKWIRSMLFAGFQSVSCSCKHIEEKFSYAIEK